MLSFTAGCIILFCGFMWGKSYTKRLEKVEIEWEARALFNKWVDEEQEKRNYR
jgi:uncharacterized membrane protein